VTSPLTFFLSHGFTQDWHLHDSHSHDGRGMPEDFARAAMAKGLRSICITSHIETFNPEKQRYEIRLPDDSDRLEKSRRAVAQARERVPGVEIKFGVELENNPGYYSQMEEILGRFTFDYVIGSVHNIGGRSITSPFCTRYLASQPPGDVYARYYEEMAAFAEWGRFSRRGNCGDSHGMRD
jgi:histidinol-phosphatase (PHP family)